MSFFSGAGVMGAIYNLFGSSPAPTTVETIVSNPEVQAAASSAASAVSSNSRSSSSSSATTVAAVANSPAVHAAVLAAAPDSMGLVARRKAELAAASKGGPVTKTAVNSVSAGLVASAKAKKNANLARLIAENERLAAMEEASMVKKQANENAERARRAALTPAQRAAENTHRDKMRENANARGRFANVKLAQALTSGAAPILNSSLRPREIAEPVRSAKGGRRKSSKKRSSRRSRK